MTTLSLKLPPEVAKIMPWIISAKASGRPNLEEWAKREYEIAQERARERERWEREREERERRYAEEKFLRATQDAYWDEFDRVRGEEWAREDRLRKYWAQLGFYSAEEDGFLEPTPTHSSQKGWRLLLSECPDLCERGRYGMWGCITETGRHTWRNHGRKPRKPWFKKTRAIFK